MPKETGITVLMVGGRRCGKTTALSSTYSEFKEGQANKYFTIANDPIYGPSKSRSPITGLMETRDSLEQKHTELVYFLERGNNNTFLVDSGPSLCEWRYGTKIQVPGNPRKSTMIKYIDCPGEFYQNPDYAATAQELIDESDVFIIVVDTPYLMEADSSVNKATNAVDTIHNFITGIDNDGGKYSKMVMFVPIKCEKWVKERRINDVVERIKTTYETSLQALMAYNNFNICIMPIETAGNIIFSELTDPYTITMGGNTTKCCKINDRLARLADGTMHGIEENDQINQDAGAAIPGFDILRPYSWFHINRNATNPGNLYEPHNCDQLPLHILRFMARKVANEGHGPLYSFFFGGISRQTMEQKLQEMTNAGIFKDNVDGIVYLKYDNYV